MKKLLLLSILFTAAQLPADSQSFTVHDLIVLANLQPAEINHYMYKNGFTIDSDNSDSTFTSYIQRFKSRKVAIDTFKSIQLYEKAAVKYFVFNTSSMAEYIVGRQTLVKDKFVYDTKKDIAKATSMLFQKANVTIESTKETKDTISIYTFRLQEKHAPDSVAYAEDLLQFNSHEYLVAYFGEKNVKNDLYYMSEKQTKKCSVLFDGTPRQAVFVWADEANLDSLAYILISTELPTKEGKEKGILEGMTNSWKFHSGIYWGMPVKEMLRLNQMDFYIYGNKSDLAMMAKPAAEGNIDFKKIAIMFSCQDCDGNEMLNQDELSALEAAKARLPLKIFDIILYP